MEEIENGCLWIWETDTDYLLCEWDIEWLPTLYEQDDEIYEYNQRNQTWSRKSCTIFSAVGAVSDLFNYKFSLDEIKEIDEMSYQRGRVKWSGWRVKEAIDLVRDWWNNNKKLTDKYGKVAYYRVEIPNSETLEKITNKWYWVCTWYYGNAKWNSDYQADWVLNGTEFWVTTYWHAINLRKWWTIKDNYYWDKYNIYKLGHKPSEIKWFHAFGYLYTKVREDALDEIKRLNELKTKVVQVAELNSQIWHLVNDTTYKNKLHEMNTANRKKLSDIESQLNKYS